MLKQKKMEEFDAIQYTGDNANKVMGFIAGLDVVETEINGEKCLNVSDPTGIWFVELDHWVLKTIEGEVLGTCSPNKFWDYFEDRAESRN
jgi:hypothetical protein